MYYHCECQKGKDCIIIMNVKKGKGMYYRYECQKRKGKNHCYECQKGKGCIITININRKRDILSL